MIFYLNCRMKSFEVNGGKVLVAKHKGELYAIGNKCSHYGAPLEKGALCNGRVRCPWHGACFSLKSGKFINERNIGLFYGY